MKRFLILFLIFIFSLGAVSAGDANLTDDGYISVDAGSDTDVSPDISSNESDVSKDNDFIDVSDWKKDFPDISNLLPDYSDRFNETYTDLRNNAGNNFSDIYSGIIIDNGWNVKVPNFNDSNTVYDLLIKSNDLNMCYLYLMQYTRLGDDYRDHVAKIWDAIRYIEDANTKIVIDPKYYPDPSDPCYDNRKTLSFIVSSDLVKYYMDDSQFEVRLLTGDFSKNNTKKVSFVINGRTYNRSIDENGYSRININLGPGVYNITAISPFTGERKTNKITVLSLFESNDLIKYYRNGSQFIVKIFNKTSGNVTFNINGVFYTRMINESGYAKLNINLAPGDYIITTDYMGCKAANNVSVLSVLSSDDLDMKYRDGSKFKVTLVDGVGNKLANAFVTFNIHGVFYKRMTDVNGEAKLNINLMAGEYIITSSYNGMNVANKITITS